MTGMKAKSIAVLGIVAGLAGQPALAGFEWNAPAPAPAATPSALLQEPAVAAPAPAVFSEPLAPIFAPPAPPPVPAVTAGSGLVINPYPEAPFDPAQDDPFLLGQDGGFTTPAAPARPAAVPSPRAASLTDLPMPGAGAAVGRSRKGLPLSAPLNPVVYEDVQGFARDIPLAIALSQVVPADYTYTFAPDVNPGIAVSWQGGVAWDKVLQSMLAPAGLGSSIRGRTVYVGSSSGSGAVQDFATAVAAAPVAAPGVPTPLSPVLKASEGDVAFTAPPRPQTPLPVGRFSEDISVTDRAPVPLTAVEAQPLPGGFQETPEIPQSAEPLFEDTLSKPGQGGGRFNPAPEEVPFSSPPQDFIPASLPDTGDSEIVRTGYGLEKTRTWRGVRGDSLRTILTDWSEDAGVEVYWSSQFDYPLDSSVRFTGTFEEAVKNVLSGLRDARPRPVARLHPNLPDGPPVLVLETQQVIQ